VCRREAPDVEQFAREHADEVRVIGLGTQDSADEAAEFVESYDTYSFPMYWDETFQSWASFGVQSQPAAALLAPDGSVLGSWFGAFPPDEVLSLVRNS